MRQKVNLSSHCLGGMSGMGAEATCPPPEQARRTILLLPASSLPHDSNSSLETSSPPARPGFELCGNHPELTPAPMIMLIPDQP